jgi:hypothetical protein
VQLAAYRSSHCRAEVEFQGRHFRPRDTAAIDPEWRAAFDAARPLVAFERMLDFHCPRRTAPVRIVYEQMSDLSKIFDCDLLEVLEATSWPKP